MQFNMFAELSKQAMQAYDLGQQLLTQEDEGGSDDLDVDAGLGMGWDWKNDAEAAKSADDLARADDQNATPTDAAPAGALDDENADTEANVPTHGNVHENTKVSATDARWSAWGAGWAESADDDSVADEAINSTDAPQHVSGGVETLTAATPVHHAQGTATFSSIADKTSAASAVAAGAQTTTHTESINGSAGGGHTGRSAPDPDTSPRCVPDTAADNSRASVEVPGTAALANSLDEPAHSASLSQASARSEATAAPSPPVHDESASADTHGSPHVPPHRAHAAQEEAPILADIAQAQGIPPPQNSEAQEGSEGAPPATAPLKEHQGEDSVAGPEATAGSPAAGGAAALDDFMSLNQGSQPPNASQPPDAVPAASSVDCTRVTDRHDAARSQVRAEPAPQVRVLVSAAEGVAAAGQRASPDGSQVHVRCTVVDSASARAGELADASAATAPASVAAEAADAACATDGVPGDDAPATPDARAAADPAAPPAADEGMRSCGMEALSGEEVAEGVAAEASGVSGVEALLTPEAGEAVHQITDALSAQLGGWLWGSPATRDGAGGATKPAGSPGQDGGGQAEAAGDGEGRGGSEQAQTPKGPPGQSMENGEVRGVVAAAGAAEAAPASHREEDDAGDMVPAAEMASLREVVKVREAQLAGQAEQLAEMQAAMGALQRRNERLVLREAKVSEEDMEELQHEFEERLGKAERRVFTLIKERDAARREAAAAVPLASLHDRDVRIRELEKEKAASQRSMASLNSTIEDLTRRLTAKDHEVIASRTETAAAVERVRKAEVEQTAARADADAARAAAQQAAEGAKTHAAAALRQAQAAANERVRRAEEQARVAEEEGGAKVRAQRDQLAEQVAQLQRQLQDAARDRDLEEQRMRGDVDAAGRALRVAEARYEAAEAAVVAATQPLLRQAEALRGELEGRSAELRAAEAAAQRHEAAAAAAVADAAAAAGRAAAAEQAAAAAVRERDMERAVAARADEAAAAARQDVEAARRRERDAAAAADRLASEREHMQLELNEVRHLLERAKQEQAAGAAAAAASMPLSPQALSDSSGRHRSVPPAQPETSPPIPAHAADVPLAVSPAFSTAGSRDASGAGEQPLELLRQQLARSEYERRRLEESMYELARDAEAAKAATAAAEATAAALVDTQRQHEAAIELLGEREERIEELITDIADMKQLYREQIDIMATQLAGNVDTA
eukprot:jgi/Ulvmu1/6773/UM030_0111.1